MTAGEYRLARRRFDLVRTGQLDAWDFAWAFAMLRRDGLSLIAARSLISNTGFGPDATHTRTPWASPGARSVRDRTGAHLVPIRHPETLVPSPPIEAAIFRARFPFRRRVMTLLPSSVSRVVRGVVHGAARAMPHTSRNYTEVP
jgi:hypothetical protein